MGRKTKEYQNIIWTKTANDLDFIIQKDGVVYGVEVKNWFSYVDDDLYDIKLEICRHFGIRPLFMVRMASYQQIEKTQSRNGRILIFKSKIFPPGNDELVKNIWNKMRLPVSIWTDIPPLIVRNLLAYHATAKGSSQYV